MPKHQTLGKELKKKVILLKKQIAVKRVSIGPYENCRHKFSPGRLKIQRETTSGWKLNAYDGSGIYVLYVYLEAPKDQELRRFIAKYIENI